MYKFAHLQLRYCRTLESVHKFADLFVLLLQCIPVLAIYRITYVFMMSSNTTYVRTSKHSLDRNVQKRVYPLKATNNFTEYQHG